MFTISKDLVSRVLSKIVESVAEEMSRLMQCVSSFSKNGTLQVHRKIVHYINLKAGDNSRYEMKRWLMHTSLCFFLGTFGDLCTEGCCSLLLDP